MKYTHALWSLFLPLIILWSLLGQAQQLRLKNKNSDGQFEQLKNELRDFRSQPSNKNKQGYTALIDKFDYFSKANSRNRFSGAASFYAARLREEVGGLSGKAEDFSATVEAYISYVDRFPADEMADEALYRAAKIYATRLANKAAAAELLRKIVKRNISTSYYLARAMSQLASLSEKYKTIIAVEKSVANNQQQVTIRLNGKVPFSSGELAAFGKYPRRLYLDLKPLKLKNNFQEELSGFGIRRLRYAQFHSDIGRIVFELDRDAIYVIDSDSPTDTITISVGTPGRGTLAKNITAPGTRVKNQIIPLNIDSPLQKGFKVVIDPGHGGNDPGAIGPNNVQEKLVTLQLAKRIAQHLRTQMPDVSVYLTRTDDRTLSLSERTEFANRARADLFISVHANAAVSRAIEGIETYYLDITNDRYAIRLAARENEVSEAQVSDLEYILADLTMKSNTQHSIKLGDSIQKSMLSKVRESWRDTKDLGLKHALFYVLMGAKMPAILIESSFISNPKEEKRLTESAYQDALANGVVLGIQRYMSNLGATRRP